MACDQNPPMTKDELVARFLFGLNLTANGQPFPDEMFDFALKYATEKVETDLGINIYPVEFFGKDDGDLRTSRERDNLCRYGSESHDYYGNDQFLNLVLRHKPLRGRPSEIRVVYPGYESPVFTFPAGWITVVIPETGTIQVIPSVGTVPAESLYTGLGIQTYFVHNRGAGNQFPGLLKVDYKAGFDPGRDGRISQHSQPGR